MRGIIVTGATGFIGRALVRRLRDKVGPDVPVVAMGSGTVDLVHRDATFDWFEKLHWTFECEHVIHLAALYKAGDWPLHHPATQFHVNMAIVANTLEAWSRFFPRAKLTSVIPYCVYPNRDEPIAESAMWGTEPEDYLFAFAPTRKALVIGQRAYRQQHGLRSTTVVLPTIYGPGDSFAENSHVIGALVGKLVRAARSGQPSVEIWGTGQQEREFMHVDDAADGILLAATKAESPVLNVGLGKAHSIAFIAETIRRLTAFSGELAFNPSKFVGVRRRLLDSSLAAKEIGWRPSVALEAGLESTVASYRDDA